LLKRRSDILGLDSVEELFSSQGGRADRPRLDLLLSRLGASSGQQLSTHCSLSTYLVILGLEIIKELIACRHQAHRFLASCHIVKGFGLIPCIGNKRNSLLMRDQNITSRVVKACAIDFAWKSNLTEEFLVPAPYSNASSCTR
jgi:hypothetical protein